jgi:hypothetical protein
MRNRSPRRTTMSGRPCISAAANAPHASRGRAGVAQLAPCRRRRSLPRAATTRPKSVGGRDCHPTTTGSGRMAALFRRRSGHMALRTGDRRARDPTLSRDLAVPATDATPPATPRREWLAVPSHGSEVRPGMRAGNARSRRGDFAFSISIASRPYARGTSTTRRPDMPASPRRTPSSSKSPRLTSISALSTTPAGTWEPPARARKGPKGADRLGRMGVVQQA